MADPITLMALGTLMATHAPAILSSLRGTLIDKGRDVAIDKGKEFAVAHGERFVRRTFQLDEKEQLRHLEQALKNANERGLAHFNTPVERDRYKDILQTLAQEGPSGEALRHQILQLFTLSAMPDMIALSDLYNQRKRFSDAGHKNIDATPYLNRFFDALHGELYADPYFRSQLSDVLQQRAAVNVQQSLLDIITTLKELGETLENDYKATDFERDVAIYSSHIARTLHNLKIVGIVPKDLNADPELRGIFVPLRITMLNQASQAEQTADALVAVLKQSTSLVLLGGPGSGKSTATEHLAWSHASGYEIPDTLAGTPLLPGCPLPLRIELRRLSEERKHENYDFLSFATQVLLKREGVEVNEQMFKELLVRRRMLLLFDGLDEVATLDERRTLAEEIEHFALCYPGNYVLVTSRPIGYELARVSHPIFSHTEVQPFNDEQSNNS